MGLARMRCHSWEYQAHGWPWSVFPGISRILFILIEDEANLF